MPFQAKLTSIQHRRRKRRVLGAFPVMAVAWAGLSGIPFSPAATTAGTMDTEIIALSGPDADPLAPVLASGADAGASAGALRSAPDEAAPGWSASIDVADGTQAAAVSWTGAPTGAVMVRGGDGTTWGEWAELEANPDEGPEDAERDSGGMAWFGAEGVDRVQVKVTEGQLSDLELQTMRYDEPSSTGFVTGAAGAAAAKPDIIPRSSYTTKGWATGNAGCAGGPTTASAGIKYAVVHHTVNSNTYAASDVPAMMASIYAYHTGTNGWCDIGYNFIVDRFGRIWEGRSGGVDKAIVGGHASGFNTGSVGVSFLGQYEPGASPTAVEPNSAALTAAGKLIGWKLGLHGIDPTGTVAVTSGGSNKWKAGTVVTLNRVSGHSDVGYTACPGENLYGELVRIRQAAKSAQSGGTTTTPPTTTTTTPPTAYLPFNSASALVTQQYNDVLRRSPTSSDLAYWNARVGSSWSPGQFIAHLESSTEADNRVHAVTRLYRAYFLRNPDHNGFTYWMNRRGEGRTLASISASFAGSSEFTRRYGTLSNSAFVDRVYQNVLGRPADSGGLRYWKARLDAGMSRGQVMANFSQSTEYVRYTNEGVWVVGIYEALLQSAAPNDVYTLFVAGMKTNDLSLTSVATYVFDGTEYRNRIN